MKSTSLAALVLVLVAGLPVVAHHAFATYYFEEQSVSIEGVLVEFELKAPHAWVHLIAPGPEGRMQRYGAEWANPTRLSRDGIDKDTLRAGDRVVITGSPGRVATDYKIHLKRITRPSDGWTWRVQRR